MARAPSDPGITLVPFTEQHFALLRGWFADEAELVQWAGPFVRSPLDDVTLRTMLAETQGEAAGRRAWTGLLDDVPAMHAQLVLEPALGVARLARVAVAPPYRGRGLAVPFLRLVLRTAFDLPWLERLELNVRADNLAALRTYAALGFRPEGIRRSAVPVGDARWDIAIQAILRPEFTAMETAGPCA